MVTTPPIPKESPKQKSREIVSRKPVQDAVRDVQQIIALTDSHQELKSNNIYWREVLDHLDPDGTLSIRRV
jgi:hypothetical protein